jgi:hypothetical protein
MPKVLDDRTALIVDALCEAIVPGSTRVGPGFYVDAVLARMGEADRAASLAAINTLADAVASGPEALAERALTPEFLQVRALVIEAYYSDFVAPGLDVDGAWQEIDFNSPLATRLHKDWSYLGVTG